MKKKVFLFAAAVCCAMSANAQLKVKSNGYVGIGMANPQYLLDVDINKGVRFNEWTDLYLDKSGLCGAPCLYPEADWYMQLGKREKRVGTIFVQTIHVNKTYTDSDSTFKCDFKKLNREQVKFRQIKPYKYHFTKSFVGKLPEKERSKFNHEHYGFKAQEIEKIYPELTYKDDSTGKYSIDYIGFIPILVEMVQELQSTVDAQSRKIKELEALLNNSKFIDPRGTKKRAVAPVMESEDAAETNDNTTAEPESIEIETEAATNAFLFQNTPNPFSSETEIKYFLPENAENAVLYVFSLNGNMLLSKPLTKTGNGSITISGSELEAGMYIYTLAIGGVEVDSKRMILADK
ncbi:MAG: tail fiber domain-containing protein [Salinivirgaceae bacterium]|nr:tail fiber domain-containing protein [Salinivirgaceae bacterium]